MLYTEETNSGGAQSSRKRIGLARGELEAKLEGGSQRRWFSARGRELRKKGVSSI